MAVFGLAFCYCEWDFFFPFIFPASYYWYVSKLWIVVNQSFYTVLFLLFPIVFQVIVLSCQDENARIILHARMKILFILSNRM